MSMKAKMESKGRTIYLDLPIDSPMAQVQGFWFGQPVVYGPFNQERIMLVVKGRMPQKAGWELGRLNVITKPSGISPLAQPDMASSPRPAVKTKEEALEGIRDLR